jgi:hypothetical protein
MDEPIKASPAPALSYGVDGRAGRRRRWVMGLVAFILLLSVAATIYHFRQPLRFRWLRSYWSWQALRHVTPPETALIEWDLSDVKTLLASHPDYVPGPYRGPVVVLPGVTRTAVGGQASAEYVPQALRKLYSYYPPSSALRLSDHSRGVVFLGQRRTPAGERRIVVIYGCLQNALTLNDAATIPHEVFVPPSLFGAAPPAASSTFNPDAAAGSFESAMLRPGIADPDDATHLTIEFDIVSRPQTPRIPGGTVDVRLMDDNTLRFSVRPAPAAAP